MPSGLWVLHLKFESKQVRRVGSQKRRQRRMKLGHDCNWSEGKFKRQSRYPSDTGQAVAHPS